MDKEIEGIVEIGSKPIVERRATATGLLNLSHHSTQAIQKKTVKKGDVLEASTIAAIQAVKDKYPKTITGGTTIGEVPDWVQEAADALPEPETETEEEEEQTEDS